MKKQIINNQNIRKIQRIFGIMFIFGIMVKTPVILAQSHEFSVYAGSGLSTLSYQPTLGNRSGGMGADFGVGYTYFKYIEKVTGTGRLYRQQWGIHTGLGLGFYNAGTKLNNVDAVTENLDDGEQTFSNFVLTTTLSGYDEKQKTMYLNIPAMALFQLDRYYVLGGFKFGFPINRKYQYQDATLTNIAYYPDLKNWITDRKDRGIGEFKGESFTNNLDLGVVVMLALEGGATWRIHSNLTLYTGVYFDYGLNNLAKGGKKDFINYDLQKPADFTTNSVLSSFTDKVKITAVGIKLRIAMVK